MSTCLLAWFGIGFSLALLLYNIVVLHRIRKSSNELSKHFWDVERRLRETKRTSTDSREACAVGKWKKPE